MGVELKFQSYRQIFPLFKLSPRVIFFTNFNVFFTLYYFSRCSKACQQKFTPWRRRTTPRAPLPNHFLQNRFLYILLPYFIKTSIFFPSSFVYLLLCCIDKQIWSLFWSDHWLSETCTNICCWKSQVDPYGNEHRVGRVLSFISSRRNWDSPKPLTRRRVYPPSRGEGTLAGERWVGRVPIPMRGHTLWYSLYLRTSINYLWCRKTCLTLRAKESTAHRWWRCKVQNPTKRWDPLKALKRK